MNRLMRWPVLFCLLMALPVEADAPKAGAPEATLRAFIAAWNRADLKAARGLIADAKPTVETEAFERRLKELQSEIVVADTKFTTDQHDDVASVVTDGLKLRVPAHDLVNAGGEKEHFAATTSGMDGPDFRRVPLKSIDGVWKLVAESRGNLVRGPEIFQSLLQLWITQIKYPEVDESVRQREKCQSEIEWVMLALQVTLEDFDGKLLLRDVKLLKALQQIPGQNLCCPMDKVDAISYEFNFSLDGLEKDSIRQPERTVLFYEGHHGQLDFRHPIYKEDGSVVQTANVGFVDGHSASFTRERAATLIWKP